jgi:hypothetical protein
MSKQCVYDIEHVDFDKLDVDPETFEITLNGKKIYISHLVGSSFMINFNANLIQDI